jgi:hypothetical protein
MFGHSQLYLRFYGTCNMRNDHRRRKYTGRTVKSDALKVLMKHDSLFEVQK